MQIVLKIMKRSMHKKLADPIVTDFVRVLTGRTEGLCWWPNSSGTFGDKLQSLNICGSKCHKVSSSIPKYRLLLLTIMRVVGSV
jgi:hypothetical protein